MEVLGAGPRQDDSVTDLKIPRSPGCSVSSLHFPRRLQLPFPFHIIEWSSASHFLWLDPHDILCWLDAHAYLFVLVSFWLLWQITERNNLKRGKVWYQMFQSIITWSPCFGSVVAQYIIMWACGTGGLFISWHSGNKNRERKGPGQQHPLQEHTLKKLTPSTRPYLLKPFHHFSIVLQVGNQAFNTWPLGKHLGSKSKYFLTSQGHGYRRGRSSLIRGRGTPTER